ncbi:hypothetical protein [Burkholderia sp. 3C]
MIVIHRADQAADQQHDHGNEHRDVQPKRQMPASGHQHPRCVLLLVGWSIQVITGSLSGVKIPANIQATVLAYNRANVTKIGFQHAFDKTGSNADFQHAETSIFHNAVSRKNHTAITPPLRGARRDAIKRRRKRQTWSGKPKSFR